MKNLDQIRAANALNKDVGGGPKEGRNIAKKVPTMIRENGLLGAAAFAYETGEGYADVFNLIIAHLRNVGRLPDEKKITLELFIEYLSKNSDAATLRALTAESMAYLNFLRRFAEAKGAA